MNAVIVTFERLPLHLLGCYGNEWISTPNFDRLAAQGVLFEEHIADDVRASHARIAWETGRYGFLNRPEEGRRLLDVLSAAGVECRILEEGGSPGQVGWNSGFDDAPFGKLVNKACEAIEEMRDSRGAWMCWLRSEGVPMPCRPPRELVELYFHFDEEATDAETDEEDKSPPAALTEEQREQQWREGVGEFEAAIAAVNEREQGVAEPGGETPSPWAIVGRLAAAYVTLLDLHLGTLLDALEPLWDQDCLVIVAAEQGMQAGVLRPQPHSWPALAEEQVHLPLLVRVPGIGLGNRRRALTQPVDFAPTLAEWFGVGEIPASWEGGSLLPLIRDEVADIRPAAFVGDGGHVAGVRTHDFYYWEPAVAGAGSRARLFVKPDDIWEILDVAPQSPGEAERLSQMLADFIERPAPEPPRAQ